MPRPADPDHEVPGSVEAYMAWASTKVTTLAQAWWNIQIFRANLITVFAELQAYLRKHRSSNLWYAPGVGTMPSRSYFTRFEDFQDALFVTEFLLGVPKRDRRTGVRFTDIYFAPWFDVYNYPIDRRTPIPKASTLVGEGLSQGRGRTWWLATRAGEEDLIFRRA